MSNFLDALKVKASEVQTSIPQPVTPKNVAPIVPIQPATTITTRQGIVDRVDIIESRNRIDVFFVEIPNVACRSAMKSKGFRFRMEPAPAWYNEDTQENRTFLNEAFHLDIMPRNGITPPLMINVAPIAPIGDQRSEVPENYQRYLQQTSELLAELGIEFADLALVAVDCLHKQTFGK